MKNYKNYSHDNDKNENHITSYETGHLVDIERLRSLINQDGVLCTDDEIVNIYRFLDILADIAISMILNDNL